jgi:hypothetical protein
VCVRYRSSVPSSSEFSITIWYPSFSRLAGSFGWGWRRRRRSSLPNKKTYMTRARMKFIFWVVLPNNKEKLVGQGIRHPVTIERSCRMIGSVVNY